MTIAEAQHLNERFTRLSDRFRSLWTFYQFLGGVFKHLDRGEVPFRYDFQELYRRVQEIAPRLGTDSEPEASASLDELTKELWDVQRHLAEIDAGLPPSLVRRFFDRLQRQDERILSVLSKFYFGIDDPDRDVLDKLDILLTRLASAPLDNGRVIAKDRDDLRQMLVRLTSGGTSQRLDDVERSALIQAVRELAEEIEGIDDFGVLLDSGVLGRLRELKERLGRAVLDPELLLEVVSSNISARNRFEELYREEESRILEDTNRIFEIERYIEHNPGFATAELREQIATFRRFRSRYDNGRKAENLKREDVLELRRAMHEVLEQFDRLDRDRTIVAPGPAPKSMDSEGANPELDAAADVPPASSDSVSSSLEDESAVSALDAEPAEELFDAHPAETTAVDQLLPPDPLLNEAIHKIIFTLELLDPEDTPEEAAHAKELHNLRLAPREIAAYRSLARSKVTLESRAADLCRFYLSAAALRVKMEEENAEIDRLSRSGGDRLVDLLERASQSLERARDVDRRFHWFIEDCLYRGETDELEELHHARFRFLQTYSRLWLDHREAGGDTPL